jgi:type IV pilus assembly protein PilA
MQQRSSVSTGVIRKTEARERQPEVRQSLRARAAVALILLGLSAGAGDIHGQSRAVAPQGRTTQDKSALRTEKPSSTKTTEPDFSWLQDALRNRELMAEVGQLVEKLQKGIQYPGARTQSRILPRLPESTTFYAALPNFGESLHQALQILDQELKESVPLRDFLRKNKLDTAEPEIESGLQKFYEFSQYLGDEVVIAGKLQGDQPSGVLIAEIKKPGVREFLEKLNNEAVTSKSNRLRIFDPEQLAAAGDHDVVQGPVVLVRQDVIAIGLSVAALREFNSQIDRGGATFASSGLGQRLTQAYQGGANSLFAVDLRKVIGLVEKGNPQTRAILEKSGFADIKYLLAESTFSTDGSANRGELTFNGPRHGVASWIAAPGPMGALDFVSANPSQAGDVLLKSPAQILDDLRDIMGEAAFANLPQMEAQLNVNLKQDLLSKLGGEIAFELQPPPENAVGSAVSTFAGAAPVPKIPAIRLILRVTDPAGLQQTLSRLLALAPLERGQREEDGVVFHTLTPAATPGAPGLSINYFFLDGYLVIASDAATARDALRVHRNGNALAKSGKLHDATRGPANASMVSYQDFGQMMGSLLGQLPPEVRQMVPIVGDIKTKPDVVRVYADESSFRAVANSSAHTEMAVGLIVAAVAIPNLLRSRISANEAGAAAVVRTVNTAEITYSVSYPAKGFAPNLAMLGPGDGGCAGNSVTEEHACLLDRVLGDASCTSGKWCEKSGYKVSVRGVCLQARCLNYVVTATPAGANAGGKSFCSTSDAIVRSHAGAPLDAPLSVAECKAWAPVR